MNKNTIKSMRWHKRQLIRMLGKSCNVDELDFEIERLINKVNDIRLMKVKDTKCDDFDVDEYRDDSLWTDEEIEEEYYDEY